MQNDESYLKYRKHMTELGQLKKLVKLKTEEVKINRSKYNAYLKANPYKRTYPQSLKDLEKLKNKFMELIPNKWSE